MNAFLRSQLVKRALATAILSSVSALTYGQSGGAFTIEKSVIAAGGRASGGAFVLESAIGQPSAGNSQGGPFFLAGGFITPPLVPSAASVSVSGRVLTPDGAGLANSIILLVDPTGNTRIARTGSFGYFRFDDVETGQTYVINVQSKRFQFNPLVVSVNESLEDLTIVAVSNRQ